MQSILVTQDVITTPVYNAASAKCRYIVHQLLKAKMKH